MASRTVDSADGLTTVVVQGFRPGPSPTDKEYVYIGLRNESGNMVQGTALTAESANILGEYLRQEAEFAQTVREKGEE